MFTYVKSILRNLILPPAGVDDPGFRRAAVEPAASQTG